MDTLNSVANKELNRYFSAFGACALITLISAAVRAGYSIAALYSIGNSDPYVLYSISGSIATLVVCIGVVVFRSRRMLIPITILIILMQAGDTYIGSTIHNSFETLGPLLLAIINIVVLIPLLLAQKPPVQAQ